MKKRLLFFVLSLFVVWQQAVANDFMVDGIGYTVTSFDDCTVTVDGLSEGITGVVVIPSTISYNNKSFTVTSIKSIDSKTIDSVIIPSTVTIISERAFAFSSIKELVIPDNVTEIGKYVCYNCQSLISVKMSSNVQILNYYSFMGCNSLKKFEWHPVSEFGAIEPRAFEGCTSLTSFTIPAGVTSTGGILDGSIPYSSIAFYGCTSLDTLIIEDCTKSIYFCADNSDGRKPEFWGSSIKYLYLGRDYDKEDYKSPGFGSLEHLVIGDSVKSLKFWPLGDIKTLEIGSQLSILNDLSENKTLEYIKIKRTTPPKAEGFSNYNYLNTVLYVPKGSKTVYESSEKWKNFFNILEFDIPSDISHISTKALLIQSEDGILTIQGVEDKKEIAVYKVSGQMVCSTMTNGNQVLLNTNLKKGELVIIRIGEESVKYILQ